MTNKRDESKGKIYRRPFDFAFGLAQGDTNSCLGEAMVFEKFAKIAARLSTVLITKVGGGGLRTAIHRAYTSVVFNRRGAHMEELLESQMSAEIQRLLTEHQRYSLRLNELVTKPYLSSEEQLEEVRLKKLKLHAKDLISALEHRSAVVA